MKYYKSFISIILITLVITSCTEKNFTLNANDNKVVTYTNNDKKISEENKNITSSQMDINEEFKKFDNSINQYVVELKNLFNKNSYSDDKKFIDLQKQLFIELIQLNKNSYTQNERVLNIINSLSQNYKSSNDSYSNSDLKVLKDYLEILLKKEQDISDTKDKTIDYYIESVKNSKDNFEYFVYFVGTILIFIGTMIFITVRTLGLWQKDKINTYEDKIELLREKIEKVLEKQINNNKDEFKYLKNNYEKEIQTYENKVKELEETIVKNQDLIDIINFKYAFFEDSKKTLEKSIYSKVIKDIENKSQEKIAEEKITEEKIAEEKIAEKEITLINETNDPFELKEENRND